MKRSVRVANHSTSVSLEPEFWDELKALATQGGLTLNQLIARVDAGRSGNLSSALRVYVLQQMKERG